MGTISNINKEKEIIGLFLLSRDAINEAIEHNFYAEDCTDEFNKKVLEIILERCYIDFDFIPTSGYIIDLLELEKEKDKKETLLKLNRYKKMVQRDIVDEKQYIDIAKNNILELKDLAIKRKVVKVLSEGLESIALPSSEFISILQSSLNNVEINNGLIKEVSIHSGFQELKEEMIFQKENNIEFGFKFGLRDFNLLIQDNIARDTLTYIVGRPSNYKTGLALNLAQNAAMNGTPAALFSNEMAVSDVYRRILSRVTRISMNKLKKPKELTEEEWDLLDKAIKDVEEWPLYVVDTSEVNVTQMDSLVASLKEKYGIELFFQDYFQLIRTTKGKIPSEEWEFGEISENLRMIAKNHEVAFIALSQANRSCEARDDKRPTLSDIRNTGKAEQDAHNIFYVYRDEFYYRSQSEIPNHLEIGALKIREGELRRALFHFNGAKATIGNADPLITVDKSPEYIGSGGF